MVTVIERALKSFKSRITKLVNNTLLEMIYLEDSGLNPEDFKKEEKPEESFAQLIKMAISSSPRQRLFLTEIYSWILENYPYFRTIDQGWRVKNANLN